MSDPHADLFELQARQREAHLSYDAEALVGLFDTEFVSISDGVVSAPTREQSLARFAAYFSAVKFLSWDNVEPPIITMSNDATLASVVVRKHVHIEYADEAGDRAQERTTFAWHETWIRRDHGWRLLSITSTRMAAQSDE